MKRNIIIIWAVASVILAACQQEPRKTAELPLATTPQAVTQVEPIAEASTTMSSDAEPSGEIAQVHSQSVEDSLYGKAESGLSEVKNEVSNEQEQASSVTDAAKTIEAAQNGAEQDVVMAKQSVQSEALSQQVKVDEVKVSASETVMDTSVESLQEQSKQLVAAGDAARGKPLARKCLACHNMDSDRKKVGPGLQSIVGRKAGSMADAKYGNSLKQGNWLWDDANLSVWLCDSKEAIKSLSGDPSAKTNMPAQKVCDSDAADVIAYLKTL
ncbi:MAG: cytochrome c [Zetaproteobacteria bacterium CG_4_9_14_3_um_filter_49_83]|nr:MAG: cytochrome c [Zetaproteobacteria bacterium CG17_big_fil_post_rev_8_21_14_2_50_50_13]PIV29461.1 MAG: cytochrome c [Zetaproteobacteria bacterium CG02_land_8_20_14_3_00_50_9]PIY56699.1 MAG: cytochrome c [Zetaproteobacteria bacterium CG_4_10_14_0_8_um_filter_49_80]PJA36261.1 MAG: cytochrome c [Zetaproteobacteria bacterium CG_4_9_14_3_um_filter_49_83]